jgi:hypothetical protein
LPGPLSGDAGTAVTVTTGCGTAVVVTAGDVPVGEGWATAW